MRTAPSDSVLVIACGALAHELVRVIEQNHWQDKVTVQCLPAELHNYPDKIAPAVEKKIEENRDRYRHIFIGYADCGSGGLLDKLIEQEGISRLPGAHCYEFFSGSEAFHHLAEQELGTFYLTDYLARNFNRLIVEGFGLSRDPVIKEMMFGNYKKLVYLAQMDNPEIDVKAEEAAKYLGLNYERIYTGDMPFAAVMDEGLKVTLGRTDKL